VWEPGLVFLFKVAALLELLFSFGLSDDFRVALRRVGRHNERLESGEGHQRNVGVVVDDVFLFGLKLVVEVLTQELSARKL